MLKKKSKNNLKFYLTVLGLALALFQFYQYQEKILSHAVNAIQPDALKYMVSGQIAGKRLNVYNRSHVNEMLDELNLTGLKASSFVKSPFLAIVISTFNFQDIYTFQIYLVWIKILLLLGISFLLPYVLLYRISYLNYGPKFRHYLLFVAVVLLAVTHLKPFYDDLISGQFAIFELFIFIIAMISLPKRPYLSGLTLAFGTVLKLGSGIMALYFLIYKMRKSLLTFLFATITIMVFTLGYFGFQIYTDYLNKVILPYATGIHLPALDFPETQGINQSINGLLSMIFLNEYVGKFIQTRPVIDSPVIFQVLSFVFTNFLIFFTSWVIYKSRPFVENRKYLVYISYSLFIALIPLVSPVSFSNDMVILLIPFSVLLNEVIRKGDYISLGILVVFVFLNYIEPVKYHDNLLKFASLGYFKLAANLLLYRGNLRLLKNYSNHGV